MTSRKFIQLIESKGWYRVKSNAGSHLQFKHPTLKGRVTVKHPTKDYDIKTWNSMLKQAGLK